MLSDAWLAYCTAQILRRYGHSLDLRWLRTKQTDFLKIGGRLFSALSPVWASTRNFWHLWPHRSLGLAIKRLTLERADRRGVVRTWRQEHNNRRSLREQLVRRQCSW